MKIQLNQTAYIFFIRLTALLLVIIGVSPLMISGINFVMPSFIIILIFFWAVYDNKNIFTKEFLILLCVIEEIAKGKFSGIYTITNIILFLMVSEQRRFFINKPFIVVLSGFSGLLSLIFLFKWLIFNYYSQQNIFEEYMFVQLFITIGYYVLVHGFYYYLELHYKSKKHRYLGKYSL